MNNETITLGGGCFWCIEAVYNQLDGVVSAISGYSGGHVPNPGYRAVTTGATGHAEVVQVTFDTDVVSLQDILNIFFTIHDPTTVNRQGADVGTMYRSVIFYHTDEQQRVAAATIRDLTAQGLWRDPIVTEVAAFTEFFEAEDYHQNYFVKNPNAGYCQVVIAPKVAKFRKQFMDRLKA